MSYINQCDACIESGECGAVSMGPLLINGMNNPGTKATPVGVIQALLDPVNLEGASYSEVQDPSGATRTIVVKRIPRGTDQDATDDLTCATTSDANYQTQVVCVPEQATVNFEVGLNELRTYCADALTVSRGGAATPMFNDFIGKLMSQMNAIRTKINKKAITLILANAGYNVVTLTNTPTAVPVIQAIDGSKIEKGLQEILYHMEQNESYGPFFAIGSGNLSRFNTSAQYGCCNQYGLNWEAMIAGAPYRYYTDVTLEPLAGIPNLFLALSPGAVQFYQINDELVGKTDPERRHGDTKYGRIADPFVPGLVYDLAIEESNCLDGQRKPSWKISMYCQFGLSFIPDNAYKATDRLRVPGGINNGILLYEATAI